MTKYLVIAPHKSEEGVGEVLYRGRDGKIAFKIAEKASENPEYNNSTQLRSYNSFRDVKGVGVECIEFVNGTSFRGAKQHFFLEDLALLAEAFTDPKKFENKVLKRQRKPKP